MRLDRVTLNMYASFIISLSSQVLSSIMGGVGIFCLYYSWRASKYEIALHLFINGLIWGGLGSVIAYCQKRYFDR
jgi:hypothetical protein